MMRTWMIRTAKKEKKGDKMGPIREARKTRDKGPGKIRCIKNLALTL